MFWKEKRFVQARNFHSRISKDKMHVIDDQSRLVSIKIEHDIQGELLSAELQVVDEAGEGNVSIVSNGYHTVILKTDGTVWAKGRNMYCQCGQEDLTTDVTHFTKIEGLSDIVQVSCGTHYSVALDRYGHVWCWGTIHNSLVSPTWDNLPHRLPYVIKNLSNIIWVECGQEFFYALDKKGTLWGYGSNYYGPLGSNTNIFTEEPVKVFKSFSNVTSVYVCFKEAYAITKDKRLLRWIFGREARDGHIILNCSDPTIVEQPANVIALSTSSSTVIALTEQGVLWSWGDNFTDVLGYPRKYDIEDTEFFKPNSIVTAPANPISVATSSGFAIAQYSNGEIWGWGTQFCSSSPIRILPTLDSSTKTKISPKTAYNDYYVAFLDILGFKNLIQGQYGDSSSLIVKSKLDFLSEIGEHFKRFDANVMLMSDSIVVSLKKQVSNALFKFLLVVAEINGMLNGSLLRGAISFGELYHKKSVVFGPAFIKAYQLQEYTAIYPRIIIKPSDIKLICDISEENKQIMDSYFLLDEDNEIFFDYLSLLRDAERLHIEFALSSVVSGVTNAVLINFLSAQSVLNEKIVQKYEWILKYLFIWQIQNINTYSAIGFFKFEMLYFDNQDNIEDFQRCRPVFKQQIVILHEEFVLLENNNSFPTNTPSHQTYNSFIIKFKGGFQREIKIKPLTPHNIFNSIGVKTYWSQYEKRPVLEMTQYTVWEIDSLEQMENDKYHWMKVENLGDSQKWILDILRKQVCE